MLKKIKSWYTSTSSVHLVEGKSADKYQDTKTRMAITRQYQNRFPVPSDTPVTHPWKFDPLNPPQGWQYDPYYELWLESKVK